MNKEEWDKYIAEYSKEISASNSIEQSKGIGKKFGFTSFYDSTEIKHGQNENENTLIQQEDKVSLPCQQ